MLKPKALKKGDTLGVIGISGAMHNREVNYQNMLDGIESLGFNVIVDDTCASQYGYLSGTDAERAAAVNRMFDNDRADAVVCMRGGYGVHRMLDGVNFDIIRANPKVFLGYSDITAIHTAIHQKVGMVTFHGPMPSTDWREMDDFTRESLMRALTRTEPLGVLKNPEGIPTKCWVPGVCEGPLVGGNLTLIASACGTPWALDVTDKVLLLEDVGEKIYRLDSMLTQLRQAGMFEKCAGVVLGNFTRCTIEYPDYALDLDDIIRDIIVPAGKPVLADMMIGHEDTKITVPLGVRCRVDAGAGKLEILESAFGNLRLIRLPFPFRALSSIDVMKS